MSATLQGGYWCSLSLIPVPWAVVTERVVQAIDKSMPPQHSAAHSRAISGNASSVQMPLKTTNAHWLTRYVDLISQAANRAAARTVATM